MDKSKKIRGDRSGVSTLLIAIVIIIIVVIIAVAAYVLLSGNNNNNNEETLAPGTTMTYDVTDNEVAVGTVEQTIIGQSSTVYFIESKLIGDTSVTQYSTSDKAMPKDAQKTGTEELDTFEGTKTLEVWDFTITDSPYGTQTVTTWMDPDNGVQYKNIVVYTDPTSTTGAQITEVQILTAYDLVWQTSYNVSDSVGKTYDYAYTVGAISLPAKIVCVADCLNDQYGIMFDFTEIAANLEEYYLSDNPQGLPTDAVDSGTTTDLTNTIDGNVTVEIWSLNLGYEVYTFYYDPDTHVIYAFILTAEGIDIPFELVSKS